MDIYKCFELYNSLLNKRFVLHIEGGLCLELSFSKGYIKHLLGLQKLSDIHFSNRSGHEVYNLIKENRITQKSIASSAHYKKIEERIIYFYIIPELLNSKVIVEFNSSLCPFPSYLTKLQNTNYILYKRIPESTLVAHLTLSKLKADDERIVCYPETFFIEHSHRYISGQTLLNVLSVEIIER